MAVKLDTDKMNNILKEALVRFDEAVSSDKDERKLAVEDYSFTYNEDGQWDDLAKKRRRNKPRYTINKVAAAVNEVIGAYKQNRIETKAIAQQDSSVEEAQTYQGLVKAIMSTTDAKLAKDTAFKLITTTGFGAIRVINRYSEGNPFEQDICEEPIPEALTSVWFDPLAKDPTAKDGMYVFESTMISREQFKREYPNASFSAFPDALVSKLQSNSWGINNTQDDIRVADYYVKVPTKVKLVLLSDGKIMESGDYELVSDELEEEGITFVDEVTTTKNKVMHYKMSGAEILEQPAELPTKYLPIVRVLGYNELHDNVLHYRGIVRAAKDSQRVYNYAVSANIESVALAPKNKVLATPKMISGFDSDWNNINSSDRPVLRYNPDATASGSGGMPVPYNPSQPQPALVQQSQQAELDIQSTMGRRAPAQGESATDRSGRAILALQRQDDAVTFELIDNLVRSEEQVGAIIVDMIPNVLDTERQVAIIGDDDETSIVTINNTITDEETNEEVTYNDMNKKYRIKTIATPSYETKRSEMVNTLSTLAQDETIKPMVMDLLAKSMDFPYAPELTKRLRKVQLQQGIVEPNEEEMAEIQAAQQTPEAQAQAAQAEAERQYMEQTQVEQLKQLILSNKNLEANINDIMANTENKLKTGEKSEADAEKSRASTYEIIANTIVSQIEAGIPVAPEQMKTLDNSLQLLNADIQEATQKRIVKALSKLQ